MGIFGKIFRKNSGEVLDLTLAQKRGWIKAPEQPADVVLGNENTPLTATQSQATGDVNFFSSMAGAAEPSSNAGNPYASTSLSTEETGKKLNDISDKLYNIKQTLELLEKRMERVEIRTGIKEGSA